MAEIMPIFKRLEVYFSYKKTQSSSLLEIYRGFMIMNSIVNLAFLS